MKKIFFIFCIISTLNYTKENDELNYIMEGNLALPASQQPGPLFSFGQTIIDKGDTLVLNYFDHLRGINQSFTDIVPTFLYGITDNLSFYVNIPFALKHEFLNNKSSGIQDIYLQLEYAFYTHEKKTYSNQATIVGGLTISSGSINKIPPTGFGSPTFFIGATLNHLAIDWYCFTSIGAQITTRNKDTKFGNSILFEFGFGKNIAYSSKKWLFMWMMEFDFIHIGNSVIRRKFIGNGDILFFGPSLVFSTQRLYMQAGIAFPIYQNFFDTQIKLDYLTAINIGWKFN